jgi:hypothetical protein
VKEFIGEYGRLIILVLIGGIAITWMNQWFLTEVKNHIIISDTPKKQINVQNNKYSAPVLYGLEQDGEPLRLKISAGSEFNPLEMKDRLHVTAVDSVDGDITDRIKVYVIKRNKEEEENKLLNTKLDTSGKEKLIILSYEVENSAGFQTEKRISLLITEIGGNA